MAAILFSEQQRFRQVWLWALLILASGLVVFQVLQTVKTAEGGKLFGLMIPVIILAATMAFLYVSKLQTRISEQGISVRLFPIHIKYRFFPWAQIEQAYVREYAPITEYGGWGWRYSLSGAGKAYNISGSQGIQLELKNGKKLLIGTQKPEAAAKALTQAQPGSPAS